MSVSDIRGRCQPNGVADGFGAPSPGSLRSLGLQDYRTDQRKSPAENIGRASIKTRGFARQSIRSVANLDAAIAPVVAVPEALAHHAARRVGRFFDVHGAAIGRAAGG